MPFNVLFLPLLGGYLFLIRWNRTRFASKRYTGERLIFNAAFAGVLFLALGFLVTRILNAVVPEFGLWWRRLVPFPYSGSAFTAFLLAVFSPGPLNRWSRTDYKEEAEKAIEETGDDLDKVLLRAVKRLKPVSVTLKSGKVYLGFVTSNLEPGAGRQYISVFPLQSGYRTSPEQMLEFTTDYAAVYEKIARSAPAPDPAELDALMKDFVIALPVAEVQSVNVFDYRAYPLFNTPASPP